MKKLIPVILALVLLFAACGVPNSSAPSEQPSPEPEAPSASSAPSAKPSSLSDSASVDPEAKKTLGFTKEEFSEEIDLHLDKNNYSTFSGITPNVVDGSDENQTTLSYAFAPGFTVFFYEDDTSKQLEHIFMRVDRSIISSEDLMLFGVVSMFSIYQIDGNSAEHIVDSLKMLSDSPDPVNIASSISYSYSYLIDGNSVMFSILPA